MTSRVQAALKQEVPWPLILSYLLCSALCAAMILYRFTLTGLTAYTWLAVPNLVLAWIPFGFAIAIRVTHRLDLRSPLLMLPLGLLWLLFFPNAPYIVTDLVHLIDNWQAFSVYYDVALLVLAAFTGLGLAFSSLLMLQELIETAWGSVAGWAFCTLTWLLTAIGIYLGRVERWNSWDALHSPLLILADLARALRGGEPLLIILVYSVVNMVLYVAFRSAKTYRPN
ncbi:MAG: hypothetical protein JWN15_1496 [Firmicutes bacterium]|nr:hypothetical protein [Bacillota bacterium]